MESMCGHSYAEDEARKSGTLASSDMQVDGIHTLLKVIADIYTAYPDLWLDPSLRYVLLIFLLIRAHQATTW